MKSLELWGPADAAVDGIAKGFAIALVAAFGLGFGAVMLSAEEDLIGGWHDRQWYQWHYAQGFVGCEDGEFIIRHITFGMNPWSHRVILFDPSHPCPAVK